MHKIQIVLLIALWAAPLLAWSLPRIAAAHSGLWRGGGARETLFLLAAIAAAAWSSPSSASKSGPTNEPPPAASAPAGRINLFYEDASGRLVPLGADIREAPP